MMDESAIEIGLVNTAGASRVTTVPIATLQTWRSRRRREGPPFVRLTSGMIRYKISDLKQWIDARRVVPTGDEAA